MPDVRWQRDGWHGRGNPALEMDVSSVARLVDGSGRRSRHARTLPLTIGGGQLFVKLYPAPPGWRAGPAFRATPMLAAAGLGGPRAPPLPPPGAGGPPPAPPPR